MIAALILMLYRAFVRLFTGSSVQRRAALDAINQWENQP